MIRTEDELKIAQECIANLEQVLLKARRTHTPAQYAMMSKPFLLELQARQSEILDYLMSGQAPKGAAG